MSQQVRGLSDYAFAPPGFAGNLRGLSLPAPSGVAGLLRGSAYAASLQALTAAILRHEFPLFDRVVSTGPVIDWRFDYKNAVATPPAWFRKIPFLDFQRSGDHKYIWELNRHQHLVLLAQSWVLFSDRRVLDEIASQLDTWHEQNPFLRSVNWASALEVAMRAISWIWVLHLCGNALPESTPKLLSAMLFQHGVAISHNLSTYFAPNTHILGEAVALHAVGLVLGSESWVRLGSSIVERELDAQVLTDGFHFELSSYYHLYALDMFLFHYLLRGRPRHMEQTLRRMAHVASALQNRDGCFPLIGDDDGGRFFHPYGIRREFGRATLATCAALFPDAQLPARAEDLAIQGAWWLGASDVNDARAPELCEHLESSGLTILRRGAMHLTFDCGPLARGGAGHSHADCLALTLRVAGYDVLVDPGTFTYVADRAARDWFRGTGAHSTLRLGGRDQADPVNPFRWENKPRVRRLDSSGWRAAGECTYRDWTHTRSLDWSSPGQIRVEDQISGPQGDGMIEQNWHSALPIVQISPHRFQVGGAVFEIDPRLRPLIKPAWRSEVFGSRAESSLLCCMGGLPLTSPLKTVIAIEAGP